MRHFVDFNDAVASQNPLVESEPTGRKVFKKIFRFCALCHSAHEFGAAFRLASMASRHDTLSTCDHQFADMSETVGSRCRGLSQATMARKRPRRPTSRTAYGLVNRAALTLKAQCSTSIQRSCAVCGSVREVSSRSFSRRRRLHARSIHAARGRNQARNVDVRGAWRLDIAQCASMQATTNIGNLSTRCSRETGSSHS
jgi:hypothetical protein